MLSRLFSIAGAPSPQDRAQQLYNAFLRHEAKIGGTLFGPVKKGGRREFFCLDEYTWVWHEEWIDKTGKKKIRTTRYEVRPDGIVKSDDGKHYKRISDAEVGRLLAAADTYERRVNAEIYQAIV